VPCLQKKIGFLFPLGLIQSCVAVSMCVSFLWKTMLNYGSVDETCYKLHCDTSQWGELVLATLLVNAASSTFSFNVKLFLILNLCFYSKVCKILFLVEFRINEIERASPFMMPKRQQRVNGTAENPINCVLYANEVHIRKLSPSKWCQRWERAG
jgi:hypothetical protein